MENHKLKWGILATGNIANQFARDLKLCEASELVAVASRCKERATHFANEHGARWVFDDYEQLAKSEAIDIVYIATPHHLHYDNAMLCLEHGKHVLVEKPMTLSAESTSRLVQTAKAKGLFLMEALWTRFIPAIQVAIEQVEMGRIGQPRHLISDFGFKCERDPQHRLFNHEYGGGSLFDVGIYPLALAKMFLGQPHLLASKMEIGPTSVDEYCSMNLNYERSKAELYASIRFDSPRAFSLMGELGKLEFTPLFAPRQLTWTIGTAMFTESYDFEGTGYQFEIKAVEQALAAGLLETACLSGEFSIQLAEQMDLVKNNASLERGLEQVFEANLLWRPTLV